MPFAFHGLNVESKVVFRPLNSWCGIDDVSSICLEDIVDSTSTKTFDKTSVAQWFDNPAAAAQCARSITQLGNAGFVHDDLHWRHVALLPVKNATGVWTVQPILIDLTSVRDRPEEVTVETVVADAIERLHHELYYF